MCSFCEKAGVPRQGPRLFGDVDLRGSTAPHAEPIRALEERVQNLEAVVGGLVTALEELHREN